MSLFHGRTVVLPESKDNESTPVVRRGRFALRLDCRHYRGDRPCVMGCEHSCEHHESMGHRILIIKLGALGDVIRTEALLPGLKDVYPLSHITWVSKPNGCRMLAQNPLIDRLLEFSAETICHLTLEKFDLVISLDKEPGPAALAMKVDASVKRGIGMSPFGTPYPLNPEAHYYFALGLSDELKFNQNQSSYQRLIYQALGLVYNGERYHLYPDDANKAHAREIFESAGVRSDEQIVGLNTGAGTLFANKTWSAERFIELAERLIERGDCRVALLGGPEEIERNKHIASRLGPNVVDTGCHNSELDFAAIVERCSAILTGDTTAMHVGIAMRVPTVILFGPTCHQEIDVFGRGVKLISKIECSPCYKRSCDLAPNCMDLIEVGEAYSALARYLGDMPQPIDDSVQGREQACAEMNAEST